MRPRRNPSSAAADISLLHLQNCLVNLPASLASLLVNANTPPQNVVVELTYRTPASLGSGGTGKKSVYVGWSGMPSKRKLAPRMSRDGVTFRASTGRDQELSLLEIDATLARNVGLQDGQKVTATIHFDPPLAQTVNIEPLTAEDWEVIEVHGTFLEDNLLIQIRAIPNPVFTPASGGVADSHPLTIHLSQTSTANIRIVSLDPPLPAHIPCAKLAPDAEVIVAPKIRPRWPSNKDSRSVDGISRKSGGSSASLARRKMAREDGRQCVLLRGVDQKHCTEWLYEDVTCQHLCVWIDRDLLSTKAFSGVKHVVVQILQPAGVQPPLNGQKEAGEVDVVTRPADRLVAQLRAWHDPPRGQTVGLSSPLCAALGHVGLVGGVVRIEVAPSPLPIKTGPGSDGMSPTSVQALKFQPFISPHASSAEGSKAGGQSKAEREEVANRIRQIYGSAGNHLLLGPLTDGQMLAVHAGLVYPRGWEGGILRFEPAFTASHGVARGSVNWILADEWKLPIEIQPGIPKPPPTSDGERSADADSPLVGMDCLLEGLRSKLSHMSSLLLTGAQGSGKTSIARSVARTMRTSQLYHTTYLSCTTLVDDERRTASIKETLKRVFMGAGWGARLGGNSLLILDDLDKLCPAETELQVGNDNARSRQLSETLCSIARQHCRPGSNVVLLATCRRKDSLHNVLVGGHVVRETLVLKAPDRETRRRVLQAITMQDSVNPQGTGGGNAELRPHDLPGDRPTTADGSITGHEHNGWMDERESEGEGEGKCTKKSIIVGYSDGFVVHGSLDFLRLAGQTDGYMPGDLVQLVSRARNEALSRSMQESACSPTDDPSISLTAADFEKALQGFTPASLRNVALQTSTTTFDSIGGLHETRRILLETLQYPTKYAPIFAQCPLRLRSGLLLYGYPGCGKTLLASAVAGECGLNFITVKGPEILNKYIGASEKSVRDLFERAQAAKPCVLFFDEFDSIAPKRGHDSTGVTDRVVNQLLTQMDGAEGLSGVYVLAATSRPDLIDPALLRPGRLDKTLLCDLPSLQDRLDIIKALAKRLKLGADVLAAEKDMAELGRRTDGFSGADLQALMSNAQLEAIHHLLRDRAGHESPASTRQDAMSRMPSSASRPELVQFRYGVQDACTGQESGHGTRPLDLAEQAAIAARLESIRLTKKHLTRLARGEPDDLGQGEQNSLQHNNVIIGWEHLSKALESTRASISPEEKARLTKIYRDFVVGRSGEMRDGQGSSEIGGRSSLM